MPLFRIDVYPYAGAEKHTEIGFFHNESAADMMGEEIRSRIDPSAMYDVQEITGFQRILCSVFRKQRFFRQ